MATNYTVVLFSRQHIGDNPGAFDDVEPNVAFVGPGKDFPFDCPGVNSAAAALLMFQSRDVDHQRNVFRVNGVDVFGGLPASPARDAWNGNILLIEPHHQLRATGNVLRVEARSSDGGSAGGIDDFILDNVVIMYKTADIVAQLPTATGDLAAFLTSGLLASIANVRGSGSGADPADQRNEYILPTPAQLAAWRAVFRSLIGGAWDEAHARARMISSTYNVVRFFDTPSGRTHYLLMEGVPGQIPAPAPHSAGEAITDPADPTARGWGTYIFDAEPQRALSLSAPHLHDDLETEHQAIEAYLASRARTLLIAGTDRDQNTTAGEGRVIAAGVFDASGGCAARGTDNMQMRFASGLPHASICREDSTPIGPSRFIHVEQRRTVRRASSDSEATAGVNRAIVLSAILATFT
ncbi:hypothetical protein LuPra_02353 [Luteitalea pratensis]|uniref:Uncharacterized protein n=1 Tax=Luteitalea pratensis TaxID=1855912 RepID=A0A143PLS9_LUTPR|nr:hypothetical protein [Luteitalea pratensis]AMY09140.1 hypothetical protein LuPra_02353 [Luteitalea pratensis]